MAMTPGTYLRLRRLAAGVRIEAAALALANGAGDKEEPAQLLLELIELDAVCATADQLARLRLAFRFDGKTYDRLADLKFFGAKLPYPRVCRACGCTEFDACLDHHRHAACHWVAADLCSACFGPDAQSVAA